MLSGKRALVTGSSQGIGLAIASAYLDAGAKVVLTSEKKLEEAPGVRGMLERSLHRTHYIPGDFSVPGEAERVVAEACDIWGGLDILVNNVGTFREPPFAELAKSHFDFLFQLNVWSAIEATQAWVKRTDRGGRILFTSSLNATRSEPGHTLYDASKGAIDALVRQLAIELAPLGFTTAAVAPGLVETPLTDFGLRSHQTEREQIERQIPLGRIARVEEVAGWFVFLGSDAARYATGIVVPVDGGLDAQQMGFRPVPEAVQ
jgi:NAD(P)-dependent dehydrogenase (short-subunit alcohol dehydrogenase family)